MQKYIVSVVVTDDCEPEPLGKEVIVEMLERSDFAGVECKVSNISEVKEPTP